MPRLELKLDNVHAHGFPYACLMCGSDENPTLRSKTFSPNDGIVGCGCAAFFGPIGWFIGLLWLLLRSGKRRHTFPVPICDCCEQGRLRIRNRSVVLFVLGMALLLSPLTMTTAYGHLGFLWAGVLVLICVGLDFAICHPQFSFRTIKSEADRVVINVPNDDYPSMYQRHLDTAVLYGSVEHMGTTDSPQ